MSTKNFLSDANVQMLWEVLIDEESIMKDKRTQETFVKTLPEFYEREKTNKQTTLIGLNKQFIYQQQIVNYAKSCLVCIPALDPNRQQRAFHSDFFLCGPGILWDSMVPSDQMFLE